MIVSVRISTCTSKDLCRRHRHYRPLLLLSSYRKISMHRIANATLPAIGVACVATAQTRDDYGVCIMAIAISYSRLETQDGGVVSEPMGTEWLGACGHL